MTYGKDKRTDRLWYTYKSCGLIFLGCYIRVIYIKLHLITPSVRTETCEMSMHGRAEDWASFSSSEGDSSKMKFYMQGDVFFPFWLWHGLYIIRGCGMDGWRGTGP